MSESVDRIEVGDLVEPWGRDLDPRVVTKVDGDALWLDILGKEAGPFPLDNYVIVRKSVELT